MKTSFSEIPSSMVAYWRLNEKPTDVVLRESSLRSTLSFNLTTYGVPVKDLIIMQ
jgi:hypothetical protein